MECLKVFLAGYLRSKADQRAGNVMSPDLALREGAELSFFQKLLHLSLSEIRRSQIIAVIVFVSDLSKHSWVYYE